MTSRLYIFLLMILVFAPIFVKAQDFKGIKPVKSGCSDVEKILKTNACGQSKVNYETRTERVEIFIVSEKCQKLFEKQWYLPIGTVVAVIIEYKDPIPLIRFPISVADLEKSQNDAEVFYTSKDKSVQITTMSDNVISVWYLPPGENKDLLCSLCDPLKIDGKE